MTDQAPEPNTDWMGFVAKVGIPAAIALFLTYILASNVSAGVNDITAAMNAHVLDTRTDQAEIRFYLRAICLNVAEDDAQRANCAAPLGK